MPRSLRTSIVAVGAVLVTLALTLSCDSSTESTSGDATVIDEASVSRGITEMSTFIPVCRQASGAMATARIAAGSAGATSQLARVLAMRHDPALRTTIGDVSLSLRSTKPADQLGTCGGRMTYPDYSHSNGTTTATLAFENYCSDDIDTGERTTLNGSIAFVNTGTPSASGPITTKTEANSPAGISVIARTSGGTQLSAQRYSFTNYVYTPGVPGGSPTSSSPNRLTASEIKIVNEVSGKTYRQTNYSATAYETTSGSEYLSISGRGYRSTGEYFDMTTTAPIITDSFGDYVSGQLTFTGANNTNAVLTLVPGSELQGTMTVNGTAVTSGVPVCK